MIIRQHYYETLSKENMYWKTEYLERELDSLRLGEDISEQEALDKYEWALEEFAKSLDVGNIEITKKNRRILLVPIFKKVSQQVIKELIDKATKDNIPLAVQSNELQEFSLIVPENEIRPLSLISKTQYLKMKEL